MSEIKKEAIKHFLTDHNTVQNTFRTLVLFGKNTATYKFAFCHALLKQKPQDAIRYDDLRDGFVEEFINHYEHNPHQFNQGTTKFTQAIDAYIKSDRSISDWTGLIDVAEQSIYNNVFDAFQNVGSGTIDTPYLLFEHDKKNKTLILTDNTNAMLENPKLVQETSLENQSRWNIVEEAWRSQLSPNLLEYSEVDNTFYSINGLVRVGLRSAVDVLLPYQKGKCFYCNRPLNRFADSQEDDFPDVDHFLPFSLLSTEILNGANRNGVWNLVIACKSCNRGERGKFNAPPDTEFFNALLSRNLLYVEEHKHSLRNSILLSLNVTDKAEVRSKMKQMHSNFKMIRGWKPEEYIGQK